MRRLIGLSGWLILWSIGLPIGTLIIGYWLYHGIITQNTHFTAYFAVHFIFMIYCCYMYFSKNRGFRWLAIGLVGTYAILSLIIISNNPAVNNYYYGMLWQAIIWIPYMIKSKRVKATFTNNEWFPSFGSGYNHNKTRNIDIQSTSNQSDSLSNDHPLEIKSNETDKYPCQHCNFLIKKNHKFCPSCGQAITKIFCMHCLSELKEGFQFCPNCGEKQE